MSNHSPKQVVQVAGELAIEKGSYPFKKKLVLGFLAGAYVAFGALLSIVIGGGVPGIAENNPGIQKFLFGAAFPLGLILVAMAGAELFTGNTAYFMPNVLSGRTSIGHTLKSWTVVYFANFVGALFVAYFITYLTAIVNDGSWSQLVSDIAIGKTSNPFYKTFLKGIGANWLVCLAMWLGMSAKSTSGKIMGIWTPVMAFVTMGFEHSIANMYFIPLAMLQGADITWGQFIINNLIPATLGNIVGGSFFVGTLYWYAYSGKKVGEASN